MRIISCSLLMLISYLSLTSQQIKKITIDPSVSYQKIESFTASDAWSGHFVGKYWQTEKKEQIAKWLFGQNFDRLGNPEGIGLSMWRVNLGAGTLEQDRADIMPFQRRAESFLSEDGLNYDWGKCIGQQYFMQKATEYGCNNFLLFSNSPPVQFTKNGKGWSSSPNEANIKPDYYSKFAGYLADVARYFITEKNWHVSYISPINEPQVNWNNPRQEGSPWKTSEMKIMFAELDKALLERNLATVKILIGETAALSYLYNGPDLRERFPDGDAPVRQISAFFDPCSPDYVGNLETVPKIIAGHSYHSHKTNKELKETREKLRTETEKYEIDFHQSEWCMLPGQKLPMDGFTSDWETENYADMQISLLLGRLIYGDLVYANAKSWGYWKGMEVNGNHALISLYPQNGDLLQGGEIHSNKLLWALGNYSFFIRPEYSRIKLMGANDLNNLIATAFINPDRSRIVVVYVNSTFETIPVTVSFPEGYNRKVKNISAYRTDARTDLANMHIPNNFSSKNKFQISPRSLVTMVFDFYPTLK